MTITERMAGPATVLQLGGRLVLDDGEQLLKATVLGLLGQGVRHLVLDVAALAYVDSAGLGALVHVVLAAKKQGGAVRLVHPSAHLAALLRTARLLSVITVCEDEAQALGSFGAPA